MKMRNIPRNNKFQILALIIMLFYCINGEAQSPDKFNYQAVVRNVDGNMASNAVVNATVSLLQGSAQGSEVFSEFQTVTTNANGLLTLVIGDGNPITSSLNLVDWANGPFFIKTELTLEGSSGSSIVGTSQLMSVPYALYAANGTKGDTGEVGADGKSAYQSWLDAGNTGTEADFLAFLQGSGGNGISDNISIEGDGTALNKYRVLDSGIITVKLADGAVTNNKLASGIDKGKVGLSNVDNTSDMDKPISTTVQGVLDTKEEIINKDTDGALTSNSDIKYPSQKAVKTYADGFAKSVTYLANERKIELLDNNGVLISQTVLSNIIKTVNGSPADANGNVTVSIAGVTTGTLAARPVSESEGVVYVVSNDIASLNGKAFIYDIDTSQWYEISPTDQASNDVRYVNIDGDAMNGNLDMGGVHSVTNLKTPTNASDAVHKQYVDNQVAVNATEIATNANAITVLETEQATQNSAIALNTAKTGVTPTQTTIISNTSGTNTGDQDISGIATNITSITALESEQITQNTAIALNTAKAGITPAQATALSNISGTNTGDQDISGIGINATAITALESEQTTQDAAIALNTAKVGISTAQASEITLNTAKVGITTGQATILSNTSGANTGDQDVSGIGTNTTAITALESEQTTQDAAIALNTAKVGISTAQASEITVNTAKVGITTGQATILGNTNGTNTGDQDISGIGTNTTAIALNTLKVGITTAQTSEITANTAKVGLPSMSSAQIVVANGSSQATAVTMTGDITISNTGSTSLADDAVTVAKIANSTTANQILQTNSSADGVEWVDLKHATLVTYGTTNPTIAGTENSGDQYYKTLDGTSAGKIQASYIYDGTGWLNKFTLGTPEYLLAKMNSSLNFAPGNAIGNFILEASSGGLTYNGANRIEGLRAGVTYRIEGYAGLRAAAVNTAIIEFQFNTTDGLKGSVGGAISSNFNTPAQVTGNAVAYYTPTANNSWVELSNTYESAATASHATVGFIEVRAIE